MTQDAAALEREATTLSAASADMAVTDAASFESAGEFLKSVALYIRRVGDVFDPIVEAAHQAHKVAVRQREGLLGPAKSARAILSARMATWQQEQTRLRREAEARAQREHERAEREARERAATEQRRLQAEAETRRLEEAERMEARGDTAGAERLLEQPVAAVVVTPEPVFAPTPTVAAPPRVSGVSFRMTWKAEVTDLAALVKAVAAGAQPIGLLQANEPALNQMARALKGTMSIPGVKAVEAPVTAVGAG